jgi:hypothetical protein
VVIDQRKLQGESRIFTHNNLAAYNLPVASAIDSSRDLNDGTDD